MKTIRLNQLGVNEEGTIAMVHGSGGIHQRMLELGLCMGANVEVLRFAPLGDPMEILIRGFHLVLRKSEAALIELEQ
jgi:ferrous iron transport protein A